MSWLNIQQKRIKENIDNRLQTVMQHGQYIMGPEVYELEENLSKYVGCDYAISCSSGTDALLMSLMSLGVGPATTIFTTPFTFIATAEVASLLGATVFFIDIDPKTYNIDPIKLEEQLSRIRIRTYVGILAVDLFGLPADYDYLRTIAETYEMFIIEDAAQSLGGEYFGVKAGGLADIGCTSFFPSKPLGCYGDGGMCFTNNTVFKNRMESIRIHGKGKDKYDNHRIGLNARLDTMQAAILLAKFDIFKEELEKRQAVASLYDQLLYGNKSITTPYIPPHYKSAWAQYSILFENEDARNNARNKLKNEGFDAAVYYPKPLHLQKAFDYCYYNIGDFPVAEDCSKRILSIPMHPYLTFEEQQKIVEVIT